MIFEVWQSSPSGWRWWLRWDSPGTDRVVLTSGEFESAAEAELAAKEFRALVEFASIDMSGA